LWPVRLIRPELAQMLSMDISVNTYKTKKDLKWNPRKVTAKLINS
jgi:hypothetical protein